MNDFLNLEQSIGVSCIRNRGLNHGFLIQGHYDIEHWRAGKLLKKFDWHNDITNEGKNKIFDVMFNGTTPITTWYIGLISNSGYSALAAGDTMASHTGWTEFTGYSQANRVTWTSGAASAQSITNGTAATFDMTGTGTVKGIFVVANNTKGGTTGTLWATGLFQADLPVVSSDQIKVTYTLNA